MQIGAVGVPPGLAAARQQMAVSLGWHIVLACFGVALPAMIWVMHRRGVRSHDAIAVMLAQRWSRVAAVLFAIGAVSGTVLSFEMGLLWPGLMSQFGDVLGLPFAIEGIAFFVEAIFLAIYLFGWNRLPSGVHRATLLPVMAAGVAGSYCVVSVNAWMNAPTGFTLASDGTVTDVRPFEVLFNSVALLHFLHMWIGAFMLVGFVVAAVYAAGMMRGRVDAHHRLGFLVPFAFASVAAVVQPFVGHVTGARLATEQPSKLAAMELNQHAKARAPLLLGGVVVNGRVRWGVEIPLLGSLAATNSLNGVVPGLDDIAEPPRANVVHLAFQTMVGLGSALAGLSVFFWAMRRRHDLLANRWMLRAAVLAGPAALVALEAGWITTEVGRQPWIVYGVQRVTDAASRSSGLWVSYTLVLGLYLTMTVVAVRLLLSMSRRWRAGAPANLPTPYGPEQADR